MPLGSLDRTPPPFFKQGPSALSKLLVFSALAVFLMVADARFKLMQPVRGVLAAVLYPLQWGLLQPIQATQSVRDSLDAAMMSRREQDELRQRVLVQAQRATQVEQLTLENRRLRHLLQLREPFGVTAKAATVLYDAADPYTRKVIIDQGLAQGIEPGSPVTDEFGVLGQVTQVYAGTSEVTLVIDRNQAMPVLNTRNGARSVAYGDGGSGHGGLELRFLAGNADVQEGDLLTTSGVDGVYPPGLAVARVDKVERRADSAFARIYCVPSAKVDGATHVMVLKPAASPIPARSENSANAVAVQKRGAAK